MTRDDDTLDSLAAQPAPTPPALSPALEAELASLTPMPPRRPRRQLAILVGISLVYGAGFITALSMRSDMAELPTSWLIATAVAWLVGFAVPCYLALVPKSGSMMPRRRWAATSAIVTSIVFVALGLIVHPSGETSLHYGTERFLHGHRCLELGLAAALVPVTVGAVLLRGALPVSSRWIAAALGAGGGCLGGLVLHLHCRVADGLHVGLIHGGVVVVAALLSAALAPRATDHPLT